MYIIESIYMLSCFIIDMGFMKQLSDNTANMSSQPPLFDPIQLITEQINPKYKIYKDILCLFPAILCAFLVPFSTFWHYIQLYAIIHLIRPIFYLSTILPRCGERKQIRSILDCLCGGNNDLIFSGHSSLVFISCYCLSKQFGMEYIWICYSIFVCILIVALKEHYTIDILVSLSVTCNILFYFC